jgi:hypothetical protein
VHGPENMTVRLGTEWTAFRGISNLRRSPPTAELPSCEMTKKTFLWQINREGQSFEIIIDFSFGLKEIRSMKGH